MLWHILVLVYSDCILFSLKINRSIYTIPLYTAPWFTAILNSICDLYACFALQHICFSITAYMLCYSSLKFRNLSLKYANLQAKLKN